MREYRLLAFVAYVYRYFSFPFCTNSFITLHIISINLIAAHLEAWGEVRCLEGRTAISRCPLRAPISTQSGRQRSPLLLSPQPYFTLSQVHRRALMTTHSLR